MNTKLASLALASIALTGCDLYWGDNGGDDVVCHTPPAELFRDPTTGECQAIGGGGYDCGPCGDCIGAPTVAPPAWSTCYGQCANLDETSCTTTPGCHAAYNDYSTGGSPPPKPGDPSVPPGGGTASSFAACWDIAPLPVESGGECWGLDAYACAQHDDCSSAMFSNGGPGVQFGYCQPEIPTTGACDTVDCGVGSHCETQCYPCDVGGPGDCTDACSPICVPDYGACDLVDCGLGYQCVERCDVMGGMTPNDPMPTPGACFGECVQVINEPGECNAPVACDAAPPACPVGTTPGVLNGCYTGYCIPNEQCGPSDPGGCEPATGMCTVGPPSCPMGSTPGTKNGCYTGYCIPDSACPQPTCEQITNEMTCFGRAECTPVYAGSDCTCTPNGCSCATQAFERCETWWL